MSLSEINDTFSTFYNVDYSLNDLFSEETSALSEFPLAMPLWELLVTVFTLGIIIIITIVGNVLVILSVFTYRPLRIVQNFFLVSLAVADLTVAVFVLPFNVAYSVTGKWIFGIHLCQMWLTCDILCCTASILSLCAIALDRYWAITDPINYAQKRTVKRVIIMIALVWVISVIICLPPLFGWNDWPEEFNRDTPCMLTQDKGFVVYSSMGSFFVPLFIMTIVYIKIFFATRKRLRERAKASKINQMKTGKSRIRQDEDSVMSDTHDQNGLNDANRKSLLKGKRKKKKRETKLNDKDDQHALAPPQTNEESTTDNDIPPRDGSQKHVKHSDVVVEITPGTDNQIHQFIREKQKISLSKERRAARTLGIIMGVFVVCWLPFFLFYVIVPYCSPTCTVPDNKVVSFITWLGYINSSLNPVIYTIFNLDFRKAFAKYLRCPTTANPI